MVHNSPPTYLKPAAADAVAATLNADAEDGWKYTAVHAHDGKGWSTIDIHDEDGHLVGKI